MSSSSSDGETSTPKSKKFKTNSSDDEDSYNEESHEESDVDYEELEMNSSDDNHSDLEHFHEESDIDYDGFSANSSDEECDKSISSSDNSHSSGASEYYIELERDWYENFDQSTAPVYGLKRHSIVRKDTLSKLMKSDKPKYKRIIEGLVIEAAESDDYEAFDRLLGAKYKFQILNDEGQTAFHLAFYHKSVSVIDHVDDYFKGQDNSEPGREADRTDFMDSNGLTHLHIASAYTSSALVENYLENNKYVNTQFRSKEQPFESGFTPLHFGVLEESEYYNARTTELLIENGADVNAVDDQGRTPLHLVCYLTGSDSYENTNEKMIEIIKILVQSKSDINAQDNDGNTPIFLVFSIIPNEDFTDPIETIQCYNVCTEQAQQKLKLLLQFNVDITLRNKKGNSLLHQVIESLKYLRYSDLDKPDYAFDDSKHIEMLRSLLSYKQKIDVDAKNNAGETPLHLAVTYLSPDIVKLLLEHNADIGNLKISANNDTFFKYPSVALSLKPVQKLLDIMELLSTEGFLLSLEENLTILNFLTHNKVQCMCLEINDFKSLFDLFHLMCLDLPEHVGQILRKLYNKLDDYDPYDEDRSDDSFSSKGPDMFYNFLKYFFYLKIGNIYANQDAINVMESSIREFRTIGEFGFESTPDGWCMKEIKKDIESLKSIFLVNDVNLHHILMKNPETTTKYFTKNNFDESCISNLALAKDIVKGHATKSLIRYYIQKYAYIHVSMLSAKPLNDICCLHIISFLSVKDVFNVCLALCV